MLAQLKDKFPEHYSDFEIVKKEFDDSRKKMQQEFEKSKAEMLRGNYEVITSFLMKAGNAVTITGNEVYDSFIPDEIDKDFDLLDSF